MDSFVGRQIERKQHLRLYRSELSDAVSAIGGRPYFVDALQRRARPYFCASGEIRARPKLISVLEIRARPASARIFAESYSTCVGTPFLSADDARAKTQRPLIWHVRDGAKHPTIDRLRYACTSIPATTHTEGPARGACGGIEASWGCGGGRSRVNRGAS